MKTIVISVLLVLFSLPTSAMMPQMPVQAVELEGKLNYPFISTSGGNAFLQLTVTTADIAIRNERKPMNLAIILDRSGSMGDERKMEYAKQAFNSLIDQLQENDILSVVVYDDVVDVLRSAQRVGREKSRIRNILKEIYPRGSTNLGGGLMEGLHQAERNVHREYVNRVVLLSDGLANVGVTDPGELNKRARQYREHSVSITTMGVGLDYNENLMMGLAESGGGNYYFIEKPNDLASIVRKEMNMISTVLVQNASIAIRLGKNVRVNDIIGCEHHTDNGLYIIPVGDLYANDRREFTVELSIPEGSGSFTVASGELKYETDKLSHEYPTFSAAVKYTRDYVQIEKNRDLETQAKADIAVSTVKVEQAMKAMDEGDQVVAEKNLNEAKSLLQNSPAASMSGSGGAAVREQIEKTESYRDVMKDSSDLRKVKKTIQYENYKTQKHK